MALLQVVLNENGFQVFHKENRDENILIPFEPRSSKMIPVQIWDDDVDGQLVDIEISCWFSSQLSTECELVYMPSNVRREVDPDYAVNQETVSFADGMPYLLIGQPSLDDLNSRLADPLPMNRFRPNLVFAGGDPYQEDEWEELLVGETLFRIVKPCARCVITTTDQESGLRGKEPLKTLAGYRKVDNKVLFGQNMILLKGERIKTGAPVRFRNSSE